MPSVGRSRSAVTGPHAGAQVNGKASALSFEEEDEEAEEEDEDEDDTPLYITLPALRRRRYSAETRSTMSTIGHQPIHSR